jgi:hypothetical protein
MAHFFCECGKSKAVELLLPRGIGEIDNKSCSCERHRFMKKICNEFLPVDEIYERKTFPLHTKSLFVKIL